MLKVIEAAIVPPGPAVVAPTACFISCLSPTSAGFSYSMQCPPFLLLLLCMCLCCMHVLLF